MFFDQNEYFGSIAENSLSGSPVQLLSNNLSLNQQDMTLKISIKKLGLDPKESLSRGMIRFKILSTREPYFAIESLSILKNLKAVIRNTLANLDYEMVIFIKF